MFSRFKFLFNLFKSNKTNNDCKSTVIDERLKEELLKELEYRTGRRDLLKLGVLGLLGVSVIGRSNALPIIGNDAVTIGDIKLNSTGLFENGIEITKSATVVVSQDGTGDYDVFPNEDASEVIQKAIDYVASKGGGVVYIREGEYDISDGVRLRNNIALRGTGFGTKLVVNSSHAFGENYGVGTEPFEAYLRNYDTENGNQNIFIKNLVVEQKSSAGDARLATFRGVSNLIVENVKFRNGYVANFEIKKGYSGVMNQYVIISGCKFINTQIAGVDNVHVGDVEHCTFEHFEISGSKDISLDLAGHLVDITITDGWIHNGEKAGVFLEMIPDIAKHITLDNLWIEEHPSGDGIHIEPSSIDRVTDVTVNNCYVNNCFRGLRVVRGKNIHIINTIFEFSKWMGIELDTVENVIIDKVRSRNNGQAGSYQDGLYLGASASKIKVLNSSFYDDQATPTQVWGIEDAYWNGDVDSIIDNCVFYGNINGGIHIGASKWGKISNCVGYTTGGFSYTGLSVSVGGGGYDNPVEILAKSGQISYFDAIIHVTAGAGESITVKFECVWLKSGSKYITKTLDNTSGTSSTSQDFDITAQDKIQLWSNNDILKQINVYAMSSLNPPSASAEVTVDIIGSG